MQILAAEKLSPLLQDFFWKKKIKIETRLSAAALNSSDLLFVRSATAVDTRLLAKAPELKAVIRAGVGLDHIDLNACAARKIRVIHSPAAATSSVAELTLMLALEALRMTRLHREAFIKNGSFRATGFRGTELLGKRAGIIGLGRIGSRVAELLKVFGAAVSAYDPYRSLSYFKKRNVKRQSLRSLLNSSDLIFIHCPLTEETRNLIDAKAILQMKPQSVLVNTARGAIVNEKALLEALRAERILSYAVDVLEKEPPKKNHPLLMHERVLWLPHLGSQTDEAQRRQDEDLMAQISKFLKAIRFK